MELEKLIIELTNAFGPSGFEGEVRNIFRNGVAKYAEVAYDNLGSIIATHKGGSAGPKILLASHMDEVGLMVRGILPSGYLKVVPLGSWWAPSLLAQRVLVRSTKGDYPGVMGAKPPHYLSEEEQNRSLKLNDLYIDVGVKSNAEVAALGIAVGDPVVPGVKTEKLSSGTLMGKAFDDRVGCAVVIQVIRQLTEHPNIIIGAGTVQEENGTRGARTVAALVQPDLCLVIEGAPADDFPDAGFIEGGLGKGPQLRFLDPTMIANQALLKLTISQAETLKLPFQLAVRERGGTDGREIQLNHSGVPTLVIGVPVRYAHSHHGIIQLSDLEITIKLVQKLIMMLDDKVVTEIKRNPW